MARDTPTDVGADERRLRWLLGVGATVGCAAWMTFALHMWLLDRPRSAQVMLAFGLAALSSTITGRRWGSNVGGSHLVLAILGGIGTVAASRGGVEASVVQWYAVGPLAAVLGGRPRKAALWGAIAVASILALAVAQSADALPPVSAPSRLGPALSSIGLVAAISLMGLFFHRHRTEAARREGELQRELFQAQKLDGLGRLAGAIAHDFNNVLMVIGTRSELALAPTATEADRRDDLEAITAAARHGRQLTGDLLGFAGSAEGTSAETLAPAEVAQEIARLLRRVLPRNITMVLTIGERIPSVITSHRRLHQVLMNLCLNAAEAMPVGGRLEVVVGEFRGRPPVPGHRGRATRHARISVIDDGTGMTEQTRARAFDPFFSTKPRGTGLGLATVQRVVADCGGVLDVTTSPGAGSRFDVYLPAVPEADDEAAQATP